MWEGVPSVGDVPQCWRVCPIVGRCSPVWEGIPQCGRVFPSVRLCTSEGGHAHVYVIGVCVRCGCPCHIYILMTDTQVHLCGHLITGRFSLCG